MIQAQDRSSWKVALLGVALAVVALSAVGANELEKALSLDQLRHQRREALQQPRRIIFNLDGGDVFYFPAELDVTVKNMAGQRAAPLVGTHVDNLTFCPTSSGFSFFTHNTRVGTVLTRQPSDYGLHPDKRNIASDLIEMGTDALQAMLGFSHASGLESFFSMRMNDTHDGGHKPGRPHLLFPPLKEEHSEWLVGRIDKHVRYGRWSAVNYAVPEIRDLAYQYFAEVCRNYRVDGIELDFFRHLNYFKTVSLGGTATDEELEMMTDLLRRIRAMSEEVGMQRGCPILIAVRVPDSLDYDRALGLDVEQWLKEGLFDILVTTGYFRLNPWAYSVELGHRYNVRVYPCLSEARVAKRSRFKRRSVECYRARAMNAWYADADGIYLFNGWRARGEIVNDIGEPEMMADRDKLYFVTVRDGGPSKWLADGDACRTVPMLAPTHPVALTLQEPLGVQLMVGEDLDVARQAGAKASLHLEIPEIETAEQLDVAFNGRPLQKGTLQGGWVDLQVPLASLTRGVDEISIELRRAVEGASGGLTCQDLVVRIDYP